MQDLHLRRSVDMVRGLEYACGDPCVHRAVIGVAQVERRVSKGGHERGSSDSEWDIGLYKQCDQVSGLGGARWPSQRKPVDVCGVLSHLSG
eukprot:scaffold2848_cov352-Pavlova_lutheri.AAC.66